MGEADDQTDFQQYIALKSALLSGACNVIDTAPNYRYMQSEKTIGALMTTMADKYNFRRGEMFVMSKAGYVPEDHENTVTRRELIEQLT